MKKILAIVLSAAALLLTLAGCGPKTASAGNASGGNAYYASAGVRGEHCRGQHRRFHAARRQNRQRHRERALAHTGDVLHR